MNNLIADYLPAAYPADAGCPPPEVWAAVLNRDLPVKQCEKMLAHADECNACATERTLARRFLEDSTGVDKDVAWIVGKLEQSHPGTSNIVHFPGRWSRYVQPILGLAAAAMLLIAFAPLLPTIRTTPDAPPDTGTLRGAEVFIVQPAGELAAYPEQFEWIPHRDVQSYRLRIYAVDDDIIWEKEAGSDIAIMGLPDELLQRYVVYYWQVEGLNADGEPVAQSRKTRFQVVGETK